MSSRYQEVLESLKTRPRTWLVTGTAGFIGSHLLETLLKLGQRVIGIDDFSSGLHRNLAEVRAAVGADAWAKFRFIERDLTSLTSGAEVLTGVDYVLHNAAPPLQPLLDGSALEREQSYLQGFLKLLLAARTCEVERIVYASSLADRTASGLPNLHETYAASVAELEGIECIGLRYAHIFGERQTPGAASANAVALWLETLLHESPCTLLGDGSTPCDSCHVANVVQANLLAALSPSAATHRTFDIGSGQGLPLLELFRILQYEVTLRYPAYTVHPPIQAPAPDDGSETLQADIRQASQALGYQPGVTLEEGLRRTLDWYARQLGSADPRLLNPSA